MGSIIKLAALAVVAVMAAIAANWARDVAYQVNALTVMLVAAGFFVYTIRTVDRPTAPATGAKPSGPPTISVSAVRGLMRKSVSGWAPMPLP